MTGEQLRIILDEHKRWLIGKGGHRADLREANLCKADLFEADLREADLREANLCGADLREANLCGADLFAVHLYRADLRGAELFGANLCRADLREADLREADLLGANLCNANLRGANLYKANLQDTSAMLRCPEEGSFIGFKKANGKIVKLRILEDAKRSSATSRKCRCSAAMVLSITDIEGNDAGIDTVSSDFDGKFSYTVGEIVSVDNFDEDRWKECSTGIHFFITREEAVRYPM